MRKKKPAVFTVEVNEFPQSKPVIATREDAREFVYNRRNVFSRKTFRRVIGMVSTPIGKWFVVKEINHGPQFQREVWYWVLPAWKGQLTPDYFLILQARNIFAEDKSLVFSLIEKHFHELLPSRSQDGKALAILRENEEGFLPAEHLIAYEPGHYQHLEEMARAMSNGLKLYTVRPAKEEDGSPRYEFRVIKTLSRPVYLLIS